MKVIKIHDQLINEEKETLLHYDFINKKWTMDSTVRKHFNKALKQGWIPKTRYEYDDGTVVGYILEAPDRSVTIRNVEKKQLSDKQLTNLLKDDDEE